MAVSRAGVIAAVLRKDFQSLWPLAAGALLLPISIATNSTTDMGTQAKAILALVGIMATVALVLTLIQQDSSTSARYDWLTRPIGVGRLLAAKGVFLFLAVALPVFAASMIDQRINGHAWGEAVLASLSLLTTGLFLFVPVAVLGLVTGSLVEAGVIAFILIALGLTSANLFRVSGLGDPTGPLWIRGLFSQSVGLVFCLLAPALLFLRKNPLAARAAWVIGVLLVFVVSQYFPAGAAAALQQVGAPRSAQAEALVTTVTEPCAMPGPDDDALRSVFQATNAPQGWRVDVDHLSVSYLTAEGKVARRTPAKVWTIGESAHDRVFLADEATKAPGAKSIRWTYALTLLEPSLRRDLVADGRRRYTPGLGYCEASRYPGSVEVVCFKPFSQPAAMTVHVKDRPGTLCTDCGPADYKPAILEGFGGAQRAMRRMERGQPDLPRYPVVTVTTYEPRAHFSRSTVTSAPAAGKAPRCPQER